MLYIISLFLEFIFDEGGFKIEKRKWFFLVQYFAVIIS